MDTEVRCVFPLKMISLTDVTKFRPIAFMVFGLLRTKTLTPVKYIILLYKNKGCQGNNEHFEIILYNSYSKFITSQFMGLYCCHVYLMI